MGINIFESLSAQVSLSPRIDIGSKCKGRNCQGYEITISCSSLAVNAKTKTAEVPWTCPSVCSTTPSNDQHERGDMFIFCSLLNIIYFPIFSLYFNVLNLSLFYYPSLPFFPSPLIFSPSSCSLIIPPSHSIYLTLSLPPFFLSFSDVFFLYLVYFVIYF